MSDRHSHSSTLRTVIVSARAASLKPFRVYAASFTVKTSPSLVYALAAYIAKWSHSDNRAVRLTA